jgi:hypothetical protein
VTSFDRESSKMLGFQVVARLAARHGIKVMLTTTPGGSGVTAIVRLPKSLLENVGSEGVPKVDIAAATARLTESLPVAAPVAVAPVSFEASQLALQPAVQSVSHSFGQRLDAPPSSAPVAVEAFAVPTTLEAPAAPAEPTSSVPTSTFATLAALKPLVTRPRSEPVVEQGGGELPKRVRGAQMPDVGESVAEEAPVRGADDVRSTLTSLQRGIDLGRQHGGQA